MQKKVTLIECPRDAMQGWHHHIPTQQKVDYLNLLLQVNFPILDCGSFVSPKAIPQMADTAQVLPALDLDKSVSKLLVIVANERGAQEACTFEQISYLGFPFSISPTFQRLNTNKTLEESMYAVEKMQNLCVQNNKELVVYISMGFGNPYGDHYHADIAMQWIEKLSGFGVNIFSLADTVGVAKPDTISNLFSAIYKEIPTLDCGAHFHSTPFTWQEKVEAAYEAGCTRFDGALKGIGGCPMAQDELVGNIDSLSLIDFFEKNISINTAALTGAVDACAKIFTS